MRLTAAVASISWIPSESIWSALRRGIQIGLAHWDEPPPDRVRVPQEVYELCKHDRFRFANVLSVWAEAENG